MIANGILVPSRLCLHQPGTVQIDIIVTRIYDFF